MPDVWQKQAVLLEEVSFHVCCGKQRLCEHISFTLQQPGRVLLLFWGRQTHLGLV